VDLADVSAGLGVVMVGGVEVTMVMGRREPGTVAIAMISRAADNVFVCTAAMA
jgi:hypothetical protein